VEIGVGAVIDTRGNFSGVEITDSQGRNAVYAPTARLKNEVDAITAELKEKQAQTGEVASER
jgi:hypothetical protein